MNQKKNFFIKQYYVDILIIFLCAFGLFLCLFFFYRDLNAALTRRGEEPIGTITFRYNVVQRRFIDRLVWDRLQNTAPIYNGDIIRTADMSEATVTFAHNDDILELLSNTLVQIFVDSSGSKINLSGGGISVNAVSGGMIISSGGNQLRVESDSVLRASLLDGEIDIAVSEGSAFVNGNMVSSGSGVFLNEAGAAQSVPQAAVVSPLPGARVLTDNAEGINIEFGWNKINYSPSELTRIEIASDRNFRRIHFAQNVQSLDSLYDSLGVLLPEGTWFWRIYPLNSYSRERDIPYSRIIISYSPAPVLITPQENQEFAFSGSLPSVRYQWTASPYAESYNFEAANNPLMQNPALTLNVRAGSGNQASVASSGLGPGTWYWRVTPVYSREFEGTAPSSQVGTVIVRHDPDFTAQNRIPSLEQRQGQVDHYQIFPPDNYVIADNLLYDTRFTWKTNLENVLFQFSPDENFSNLVINDRASLESYTIRSIPAGVYYWRVVGNEGRQRRESQVRRVTIAESLKAPDLNRVDNVITRENDVIIVSQEHQSITFSWLPEQEADHYAFRLYRGDSSSPPLLERIVYNTSTPINMGVYNDGVYTWTVQALSRENMTSSRRTGVSASQTVLIRHLKQAVLVHPPSGHEYTGVNASRNPDTAEWTSEEQAVNVAFVIARDARMTDIVHSIPNVPSSFQLPRLAGGDYYMSVRAMTTDGFDISSEPSYIRVTPIPLLPVPQNRTPANGYTVRPENLRGSRSINFSWNRVQGANGYILTIFSDTGRSRTTVIQTPVLTATNYTVEDIRLLGRGSFYWQVEAVYVMEDGFIEQRGQLTENRLNIDIPPPTQIRIRDSGELYGR